MENFIFCEMCETVWMQAVIYDNGVKFNQLIMDYNKDIKVPLM